jgi:PTH1 family peptidyl-tRNA hydrolase
MKAIVGLGNPGDKYSGTRHNLGFEILDYIAKKYGAEFSEKSKFKASFTEISFNDEKVILVKPNTFYNKSGQSARTVMDFYKLKPSDFLIFHDDMALDFGTLRIRLGGRDAGNNGVKSLNASIGYGFWRVRLGTAQIAVNKNNHSDFVLSKFKSKEIETINEKLLPVCDKLINRHLTKTLEPETFYLYA